MGRLKSKKLEMIFSCPITLGCKACGKYGNVTKLKRCGKCGVAKYCDTRSVRRVTGLLTRKYVDEMGVSQSIDEGPRQARRLESMRTQRLRRDTDLTACNLRKDVTSRHMRHSVE